MNSSRKQLFKMLAALGLGALLRRIPRANEPQRRVTATAFLEPEPTKLEIVELGSAMRCPPDAWSFVEELTFLCSQCGGVAVFSEAYPCCWFGKAVYTCQDCGWRIEAPVAI